VGLVSPAFEARPERVGRIEGALAGRAAGGLPVMDFKLECLLAAIAEEQGWFVWSDADVQPLVSATRLRDAIQEQIARVSSEVDVLAQREFDDAGVNVGFLVVRASEGAARLFRDCRAAMQRSRALDQKCLNEMILNGSAPNLRRLPAAFWASSNALRRPSFETLLLHHANFVVCRADSRDPTPKLQQLERLAAVVLSRDRRAWAAFVDDIAADPSLAKYRARHFPLEARERWRRQRVLFFEEEEEVGIIGED